MSRRVLVVMSTVLACALAVTAVALARGGSGGDRHGGKPSVTHAQRVAKVQGRGPEPRLARMLGQGIVGMVVDSLAGRLQVKPADLRTAIAQVASEQRDKVVQGAGLTQAEQDALKTCGRGWRKRSAPAGCDKAAARSAMRKLRNAPKPDLARLKTDLATSLASKLGTSPDAVLTAARAELAQRLDQAAGIGLVTSKGKELALGCFDDPGSCDLDALRAEVKLPFGHGAKRAGRGPHLVFP
jgi:hypothetical protein